MKQILITKQDFTRIHKSISDAKQNNSIKKEEAEKLLNELHSAKIVESEEIPADVVTMNSVVKIHFENWVSEQNTEFVFKETALLFELKLNESCYKSILVTADDNVRIKRVMDRDGKTYREIEAVMQKQLPEKEKLKLADFVIFNNEGLEELEEQTEKILSELNLILEE